MDAMTTTTRPSDSGWTNFAGTRYFFSSAKASALLS